MSFLLFYQTKCRERIPSKKIFFVDNLGFFTYSFDKQRMRSVSMREWIDFEKEKEKLVDYALDNRDKEMFMELTGPYYKKYINQLYKMDNLEEIKEEVKKDNLSLFVEWIEENKYNKHKLVIRFLLENQSLIDVQDQKSIDKWSQVSLLLENNTHSLLLFEEMKQMFTHECAATFINYIDNYKISQKESH